MTMLEVNCTRSPDGSNKVKTKPGWVTHTTVCLYNWCHHTFDLKKSFWKRDNLLSQSTLNSVGIPEKISLSGSAFTKLSFQALSFSNWAFVCVVWKLEESNRTVGKTSIANPEIDYVEQKWHLKLETYQLRNVRHIGEGKNW